MQANIDLVRKLAAADHGLAVAVTIRRNGTPQASVVNAGVLDHPLRSEPVVGFVARGGTAKLRHLRERPRATLVFRAGWEWVAVEGDAQLVGPDDAVDGIEADDVRLLLRAIFIAAGGQHDDFDEYDRVMAVERRTAVLVPPTRITTNPEYAGHVDR
jgi:PPOX class probable F420-dependent enzyme